MLVSVAGSRAGSSAGSQATRSRMTGLANLARPSWQPRQGAATRRREPGRALPRPSGAAAIDLTRRCWAIALAPCRTRRRRGSRLAINAHRRSPRDLIQRSAVWPGVVCRPAAYRYSDVLRTAPPTGCAPCPVVIALANPGDECCTALRALDRQDPRAHISRQRRSRVSS